MPWSFGTVVVGEQSPAAVLDFTNNLGYSVTITSITVGDQAFRLDGDGCTGKRINAAKICQLQVLFAPQVPGKFSSAVTAKMQHDCVSTTYFPCDANYSHKGKNFTEVFLPSGVKRVTWAGSLVAAPDNRNNFTGVGVK